MNSPFDARPIVVAVAGPNGAGKSTFCGAHLSRSALRIVNADDLARELELDAYEAAEVAKQLREALLEQGESFIFETVFSDPVGEKLDFLRRASERGYTVVLCFIGLDSVQQSEERVTMRVMQGGHDVPSGKLSARFPRCLDNLRLAIRDLPHVVVYDNSDMARPFRKVVAYTKGEPTEWNEPLPTWLPLPPTLER